MFSLGEWEEVHLPNQGIDCIKMADSELSHLISQVVSISGSKELESALASYVYAYRMHFNVSHSTDDVIGETNEFRYCKIKSLLYRIGESDRWIDVQKTMIVAMVTGTKLQLSSDNRFLTQLRKLKKYSCIKVKFETDSELEQRLHENPVERIRSIVPIPESLKSLCNIQGIYCVDGPIISNGFVELMNYFKEQTISKITHRYGNIF